ncbi:alpha/beta hydrolase [Zhihengliuella sp.]|uniref:alpha/beta hydrolase n=1 Tax=Zhihengliuella sp. TaxID=1954483 RepID=UPI00281268BC|nr:alpha/beta hydrolase [Zhihengliuella sp.]
MTRRTGLPAHPHHRPGARRARWTGALAAAAAVVLAAAGCTPQPDDAGPEPAEVPAGLERFYAQNAAWESCQGNFECARVEVPLDYAEPDGETIELAMIRKRAPMPEGSLLVNPGGPGASGVQLVRNTATSTFSTELRENLHLVGFDPRGVGESAPVECRTDEQLDQGRAGEPLSIAELGALCDEKNGEILAHVDTDSAARDLDILRAVNGDQDLRYLGFSYGTKLGAAYADLFPENVGRMVLDGAMDPTLGISEVTLAQAENFQQELHAFVEWCGAEGSCPLSGGVQNGLDELDQIMDRLEEEPIPVEDGRTFTEEEFVNALLLPMYDDGWRQSFSEALNELQREGTAESLMYLADARSGRLDDGTYADNSWDAFTAINCLDYPEPRVDGAALDRALDDVSPTLGWYLGGDLSCKDWPAPAVGDLEPAKRLTGDAEALVIGTTGDPATPYEWAESLAEQLGPNAHLVTYEGHGHTAYGRSNDCITRAVDDFLLDGEAPAEGLTC